jgi:phosphatidylinositol 4-kinase
MSMALSRRHTHHVKTLLNQAEMTTVQKTRLLRQNYFRCQTAFLTALEDISNRLVVVPKPARLSALRAELALIALDLPAEVDIPVICPPDLVDGSPSKSRHHRIVRLNPAEATVLNSAEKVPYLLMVEILRDDFTFDPDTQDNQRLLTTLLAEQGTRKRIFDLTDSPSIPSASRTPELVVDSVLEPASGDLGSSPMFKPSEEEVFSTTPTQSASSLRLSGISTPAPAALDKATPRSSGASSGSLSPPLNMRRMTLHNPRHNSVDQPDFSALAIHMRTASQMLAQLDATSGKRPRQEVAAIRSRIIASMQSLEEQSFEIDDGQGPTFEMIMAKAETAAAADGGGGGGGVETGDDATAVEPNLNANAGIDRMENDIKTGGLQRKGDRDDPSAAVFGEAWETKKERIRKSSPYGWMKNWDLVSVIVKTGSDLRQEAFACQLIRVCHKIWVDAGVPVWVKLMRILVTGESSGLIETIANGVSLHSIKRSLTLASIESGQNPRRRIATLKDHFVKAFGIPEGEAYRAGVDAFKRSLAAYSVISYVLQLKDRHNGNVLIDNEGHIIHIDFGFMLSNSPGSVGFEAAPFKLTYEYVDVLGGVGSQDFEEFKGLCKQAFQGGCCFSFAIFLFTLFCSFLLLSALFFFFFLLLSLQSYDGNANVLCDDSPPPLGRQHHRPGRHDGPRVQDAVLRRRRLPGHHGAAPALPAAAERRRGRAVCRDGSDCQVGGQLLYEAVSFCFCFLFPFLFLLRAGVGGMVKSDVAD